MAATGGSRPGRRSGAVTLKDVAAAAGVDPSVVSRVANSDPALNISPATRERVVAAIQDLGYRTNQAARNLRLSRNFTLGLLLPNVSNPVYAPIVQGVIHAAELRGYAVVLGSQVGSAGAVRSFADLLEDGRVDGILVATGTANDADVERELVKDDRIALVNRRSKGGGHSIYVDDAAGSKRATEHLISLGHRRIGHLAGPADVETSTRRLSGFRAALREAGIRPDPKLIVEMPDFSAASGFAAATELLQREAPSAIFVANADAAIGALRAAQVLGIAVPEELSVIAFHDSDLADFVTPPLDTVAMPLFELGTTAADLLIDRIEGKSGGNDVLVEGAGELHRRSSTAARSG